MPRSAFVLKPKNFVIEAKKAKIVYHENTNHTNMKQEKGSASPQPLRVTTPVGSSTSSTTLINIVLALKP
jgi:hypothetical protein